MVAWDRWRRWARRIVYPLLAVPLAGGLLVILYLRSGHPETLLHDRLIEGLSRALGRPVSIERIELSYLPPGVTVTGFRAEGPLIAAGRVEAAFSLRALLRGRFLVKDVDLYDPVLRWDIDTGPLASPAPAGGREPGRVAERVALRRLRIHRGEILVGSTRRSISAEVEGLSLTADNAGAGYGPAGLRGPWEGSLNFTRGRFTLDDLVIDSLAGSVSIEMDGEAVRAQRLRVKTGGVDVRGSGMVQPGSPPRGRFDLTLLLNPDAPAVTRPLHQFDARQVSAEMRITLAETGVKVSGRFEVDQPTIDLDRQAGADGPAPVWAARHGAGVFEVDAHRIAIDGTLESFSGGMVEGHYEGVRQDTVRDHDLRLQARGLRLEDVLRHYDLPGDDQVAPSATLDGAATVRWSGSDTGSMIGQADIRLAAAPGDLPVSGPVSLTWHGRHVRVVSSSIDAPGSHAAIEGTVDASSDPMGLALTGTLFSKDTAPLSAFVTKRFGRIPGDPAGRLGGQFTIGGTTARFDVSASFEAGGLSVTLPALAGPGGGSPAVPVTLDAASGRIGWRPDLLTLEVEKASAEGLGLTASLQVDPRRGEILSLGVDAAEAPADLLAQLAGLGARGIRAAGRASAKARLEVDAAAPPGRRPLRGTIEIAAPEASLHDIPFTDLRASARLEADRLILQETSLTLFGGRLGASGEIGLGDRAGGGVEMKATGIDLAAIDAAFPGPSMEGSVSGEAHLSFDGGLHLEAALNGESIRVAGLDFGRLTASLSGPPERVHFVLQDSTGDLSADGQLLFSTGEAAGAAPSGGGPAPPAIDGTLTFSRFSLEKIRPLLPRGALAGLAGDADGIVTVQGALNDPRALRVHALLDRVHLTAGDNPLHNEGPVSLTEEYGFLTLSPMRLAGEKTDLTLGGSMALGGSHEISARVSGTYDLGLLQLLFPEIRASGPGVADIGVIQRGDTLAYTGTLTLEGATLSHPSLPLPLTALKGQAEFDEKGNLNIKSAEFDIGGGHATATGWAAFEGASMPGVHLSLAGRGIRAEIIPDLRAFFDADLTLDKEDNDYRLGGKVTVQRAVYSRPFGVAPSELLLRSREFAPSATRRPGAPDVFVDIDIVADGDVWVRNEDALIEASAHLSLEGTIDKPELSGRISALEGGTYRFRDVTYRIVGGSVDFNGVSRIDPEVDISASTRVQQYEITLHITGRFSKPVFELTADPPLAQRDIVWLLLTGTTLAESPGTEASRNIAEGQVAAYLAAPVAGAVTAPLEKILGVSSVQIDPFFLNGAADPSARLTVTKRVASNLLFTYSSSLGQTGQEIYQMEYNPGRLWDMIATRDLDGSIGADIRIRRRWNGLIRPEAPAQAPGVPGAPRQRVGRIRVVADTLINGEETLIHKLPFRSGDTLRRGELLEGREAIRQHYVRHGFPAAAVDVVEDAPDPSRPGEHPVSYIVRAGERHTLEIDGDVRTRPIRRAVKNAWLEPILPEDLVEEARDAALRFLKGKGFYKATVEARLKTPGPDRRVVKVDVVTGQKVHVRSLTIEGNDGIPEERIRRQMLTHADNWINVFDRGLLRADVLQDDVNAIRSLYSSSGYLSARVASPEVAISPDGREADITIRVEEGPRSRLEAVSIEGEAPGVTTEDLLKAIGLSPGEFVDPAALEQAGDRLREALDKDGYSHARVSWRLDGSGERLRAVFALTPLERSRVAKVLIEGNARTHTAIVRREVTVKEGAYLSRAEALATQRNLYRLGVFRSVRVDSEPVPGETGLVNVRVRLEEGQPLMTAWGVGYDTEDRARGTFEVANNNLFGTRRSAALFVRQSAVNRRVQVSLRDPNLFGEKIETLLSGFHERLETNSYDMRRYGAGMQVSRKIGAHTTVFGGYLLESVDLFNLKVSVQETGLQLARLGSFGGSIAFDSRDDIVSPTRGWLCTGDLRIYSPALASELGFGKFYASFAHFKDIGRGVIWAASLRGGRLLETDDSLQDIPINTRFFAGGDTTLRGFGYNTVGPVDPSTGEALGGNAVLLVSQELRYPIFKALKGVVFYDLGNVWGDGGGHQNFSDYMNMRHDAGTGFRFDTPVGAFRVEYGWKLDRKPGESPGQFFFSIGQAF